MIVTIPVQGKGLSAKIAQFHSLGVLHLQVLDGSGVCIASNRATLENPTLGPGPDGLQVKPTDGIKSLWWMGEVWALGMTASGMTVVHLEVQSFIDPPLRVA